MIPCLDHLEIEAMIHAKARRRTLDSALRYCGTTRDGESAQEESGNGKVKNPAGTTAPALP